jgi:23S rRNA (adenine2503-C2)-methyltransferase
VSSILDSAMNITDGQFESFACGRVERESRVETMTAQQMICGMERDELGELCGEMGLPGYRTDQIWRWLYVQRVEDWESMKNLPAELRKAFSERLSIRIATPVKTVGKTDDARKVLVELNDGQKIEEVLIPAKDRRTVCVSTQVGCRYHCVFCASGQGGFVRNLDAGEIVEQVLIASRTEGFGVPTHVVFMGIGEPLDNYDGSLKAIRVINDKDGLNIGARRITISTCGIVPGIRRLMEEGLQFELSVSLHAANDELRTELMPVNRKYGLGELMEVCREYTDKTGRIITFEYALVKEVNDSEKNMHDLVGLLKPFNCRVNLIPLSPVEEYEGRASEPGVAQEFVERLGRAGVNATLRWSKGGSVRAACGQLRAGVRRTGVTE